MLISLKLCFASPMEKNDSLVRSYCGYGKGNNSGRDMVAIKL